MRRCRSRFAILYQDYPFALADLFLKRALALLAVVTIAFVAVATFGDRSVAFAEFIERDPRQFGLLMTLWVATALLYPTLRAADRVVRRHHPPAPPELPRAARVGQRASPRRSTTCPRCCRPCATW